MRRLLVLLAILVSAGCAGCTSVHAAAPGPSVVTDYVTMTSTPHTTVAVPATPPPAATVAGMGPQAPMPAGFTEAPCPYIDTQTAANLEGNRIYRTATSTGAGPVTCRFYFWCCDFHATLEIQPVTYPSADAAYNAMVLAGKRGTNVTGVPGLIPGVDAVLYQTPFYGRDDGRDWAAAFAKGTTMVIVRTDQTDVSYNARRIAATIAPRF